MKRIILAFCILNSFIAIAMDAPIRKSSSSGRANTLQVRHQRHSSMGQNVLNVLHLQTDKTEDCSNNIAALVTDRRAPVQNLQDKSKKSSDGLVKSDSRDLIDRAGEKNKIDYIRMIRLAYDAIKNIKAVDDIAHQEYTSCIKYAQHYYRSWMSLAITKEPSALETMAQEEFKPLRDAFNEKMALVVAEKK